MGGDWHSPTLTYGQHIPDLFQLFEAYPSLIKLVYEYYDSDNDRTLYRRDLVSRRDTGTSQKPLGDEERPPGTNIVRDIDRDFDDPDDNIVAHLDEYLESKYRLNLFYLTEEVYSRWEYMAWEDRRDSYYLVLGGAYTEDEITLTGLSQLKERIDQALDRASFNHAGFERGFRNGFTA